jgi:hypothetical protein
MWRRAAPRHRQERVSPRWIEAERLRQPKDRAPARGPAHAALEGAHRVRTEVGRVCQLLLREPRGGAMISQQLTE